MQLDREQLREANRLQRSGKTLREISRAIGVEYEDVVIGLYGDNVDWTPRMAPIGTTEPIDNRFMRRALDLIVANTDRLHPSPGSLGSASPLQAAPTSPLRGEGDESFDEFGEAPIAGCAEATFPEPEFPPPAVPAIVDPAVVPVEGDLPPSTIGESENADVDRHDVSDEPAPAVQGLAETATPGGGAASVEGPLQAPAQPEPKVRLTNGAGQYLKRDNTGMTTDLERAWQGPAEQAETIQKRFVHLRELDAEPVQ